MNGLESQVAFDAVELNEDSSKEASGLFNTSNDYMSLTHYIQRE